MKTLLVTAAALGLSATAAFAQCDYHKVNASVDVDQSTTTASIEEKAQKATDVVLLKKTERLQEEAPVAE